MEMITLTKPNLSDWDEVPVQIDVSEEQKMANEIYEAAKHISITQDNLSEAAKLMVLARNTQKDIEAKFEPVIEYLKDLKGKIDKCRKTAVDLMETVSGNASAADAILAHKLSEYYLKTLHDPKDPFLTFRKVWKYKASGEPLDPEYTTTDSLGFVVPDHKKIAAAVNMNKDKTQIKGVEAYMDVQIAVKSL